MLELLLAGELRFDEDVDDVDGIDFFLVFPQLLLLFITDSMSFPLTCTLTSLFGSPLDDDDKSDSGLTSSAE